MLKILALLLGGMAAWGSATADMEMARPHIRKLGTIDCDLVETTPVVHRGRLYRFEYVRAGYAPNTTGGSYFRFVDVETGAATPAFAQGYHLGSAFVARGKMHVFGVPTWGASSISRFVCSDRELNAWTRETILDLPGWTIFNTSVCKGRDGYVLAFEIGDPAEEAGVAFTIRFAVSQDLKTWKLTPSDRVFTRERYSACPSILYSNGYYYMIYLEQFPGPTYNPCIVRTRDLIAWESSPLNPIMRYSDDDRTIANPRLSEKECAHIAQSRNINNSDVDLCEYKGATYIVYSWGDQQGTEFLAEARHQGRLKDFLPGWFPRNK
ncbi:MAG TPA: hypothetical protein PLO62_00655 [Candidatus Hydrogenedentes bacterium]|nr:hypothetical protein [Candidatus Hydrogenedentota bacterium]HOS02199.1 hypothetical protein [Candidatus Hydrogenedentota bacterium]